MNFRKIFLQEKLEFLLGFFIFVYFAYFTTASFLRYDNFYTGRFDLGNMDQTVWNTINGRIFQASSDNGEIISRLSSHADFMLILLSPFYLIWPHPKMLLLIQSFVLGIGGIFVFLIAKEVLKNKTLAIIFAFLFLMNPLLQFTNLYDFHAVTLATTLLLASFYFLIKQKYFLLVIFLILSGITKEQVWVITSLFGFPLLFKTGIKLKLLGAIIIFLSLTIFVYLIGYAIPQSLGKHHFALAYYSDFGNSPTQVVSNILLSPQKLFSTIFEESRIQYLKQIFIPLGFLSLLSPMHLIFSIPDFLINLLSNNSQLHQIYYQYSATITPFIFISAIFGVKQLINPAPFLCGVLNPRRKRNHQTHKACCGVLKRRCIKWFLKIPKLYIGVYLVLATLLASYLYGPLPMSKNPNIDMFIQPLKNKDTIERFISKIPQKYSVAATNNLGSHLSQRRIIYTIPIGIDKADIVLFLLSSSSWSSSLDAQRAMIKSIKSNKNYIEVFNKDDFVVFKRRNLL